MLVFKAVQVYARVVPTCSNIFTSTGYRTSRLHVLFVGKNRKRLFCSFGFFFPVCVPRGPHWSFDGGGGVYVSGTEENTGC